MRKKLEGLEPISKTGRETLYDSADALARFFTGENLDLTRERARLAREQADAQELKNAEARGELVPGFEIETTLVTLYSGTQQRLLAVPAKAAPEAHGAKTIAEAEAVFRKYQIEALEELSAAIPG